MSLSSSSVTADLLCLGRSFTWWGVPLTSTAWGLITPSTCPLQNLVVHQQSGGLTQTGSSMWYTLLLTSGGGGLGSMPFTHCSYWYMSFASVLDSVSLSLGVALCQYNGFCCLATQPHDYSLDSTVTPLRDAITFWDISTPVSHSYAPYLGHYLSIFQLVHCV